MPLCTSKSENVLEQDPGFETVIIGQATAYSVH